MKVKNLIGQRFGRLLVTNEAAKRRTKGGTSVRMWICKCDCGNITILSTGNLTSGNTKSCGCYKKDRNSQVFTKHKKTGTKLYRVWSNIKDRCLRENANQYRDYGGRGIVMCDEWKNDFQVFYDWAISNGYKEGLTIERIDVNGNYCPENCTWIPREQQSKNRRNCHYIFYKGETKTLSEWSRILHVDRECVRNWEKKLGSGEKAIEKVLSSPRHTKNNI